MAMRPCPKCRGNNWKYVFYDNTRLIEATCQECKNIVSFHAKPRKPLDPNKKRAWCEYKHNEGKTYMRSDEYQEFTEVEIMEGYKKGRHYLRVMPVN